MTTLVTGGTGFVGGAIVRSLVRRGRSVRVLARPTSRVAEIENLGVEIVWGDILEPSSLRAAVAGCGVVYHAAALYDLWVPDPVQLHRTEVDGTRNLLDAALEAGVRKVIYTSTALTIGERRETAGDEATSHRGYFLGTYERAKFEAERLAMTYADRGLFLICVNPAAVYGPGDFKPTGRSLIDVLKGRIPLLFPGCWSIVHRDDVAEGHLLAEQNGISGERYILSERVVTTSEFFNSACRIAGRRMPRMGPAWTAALFAAGGEWLARITRRPPLLPRENFRLLSHGFRVDGSKAARDLGLHYSSWGRWLPETIQWYRDNGHL